MKHMILKGILAACVILASATGLAKDGWTPFKLDNGHIKIPVTVSGKQGYAILDSGAQINGINNAFIEAHDLSYQQGRRMTIQGVFGEEDINLLNEVPVELLGLKTDLNKIAPLNLGHKDDILIIGAGLFSNFIVQFDYPNERMRLLPRKSIDLAKHENIPTQSLRGTGEPIVQVKLDGKRKIWVLLDTGSNSGLMVERSLAEGMGWLENNAKLDIESSGVNETRNTQLFNINELEFGPFVLEDVLVNVPAEGETANLTKQMSFTGSNLKSQKLSGIIGFDVLKHFVLTLDYRRGNAHISLPAE